MTEVTEGQHTRVHEENIESEVKVKSMNKESLIIEASTHYGLEKLT